MMLSYITFCDAFTIVFDYCVQDVLIRNLPITSLRMLVLNVYYTCISLTVHNCINISVFRRLCRVCDMCYAQRRASLGRPPPRRVVSLHPGVADSNDIHNTSATPTLRTVLTVTGTARRTDTFDIILFHAHTPVTDYIVRVSSAHGRFVFLCKLRCCVTDIPYAFVHRTHLIHRSFVRRLAIVYVPFVEFEPHYPVPLKTRTSSF